MKSYDFELVNILLNDNELELKDASPTTNVE